MQQVKATYGGIWKISYPIIIGSVVQNLLNVTDTAFLGMLSDVALGASAIGGLFYLAIVMLGFGFGNGLQIIIARRFGEKEYNKIGSLLFHGFIFMIFLALVSYIIVYFLSPIILQYFVKSESIYNAAIEYLNFRSWGVFFGFTNILFTAFYVGTANTRILIISTLINTLLNVVLDYTFIFGNWGFPALGVGGAALATSISELVTTLFFILVTINRKNYLRFHFRFKGKISFKLLKAILGLAYPTMMQNFVSFTGWFVFFLIIEQLGEKALAASNIARSLYMVLMTPIWGLATATTVLVSNMMGQKKMHKVFPVIKKVILMSFLSTLVLISLIVFIPTQLISFYTNDAELIRLTLPILYVIGVTLVAFSIGLIWFNGVVGTGNTRDALLMEILNIGVYIFVAYLLVKQFNVEVHYVWAVEFMYFILLGSFSYTYLKLKNWQKTKI